jgi:cobalt/nickel transport system permease protein
MPLFAVHISDGVLAWPWLIGGFTLAALLLAWGARQIADEEIPRIGLLTAAFFVASLIHVRLGPTSVHLLLNGLVGVVLGSRVVLALAVGLFLQALLLAHGGYTTLGVNCCVLSVPALLARPLYRYSLGAGRAGSAGWREPTLALGYVLHPIVAAGLGVMYAVAAVTGRPSGIDPAFRAGFFTGLVTVVLTALLNALVLMVAGVEDWSIVAALVLAAHLPIAVIEGLVVGCTASFLARVRPELVPSDRT